MTFKVPEGTPAEIAELFDKPEVKAIVDGLAEKNTELLGKLSLAKKDLNDFGGAEAIRERLAELETLRGEVDAAKKTPKPDASEMTKALQDQLKAANDKLAASEQQRITSTVAGKLAKAIKDAGGDPDLLDPFISKRVKSKVAEDGTVGLELFTEAGGPLLDANGQPANLSQLVSEFKSNQRYGVMFAADNKQGSGTNPAATSSAAIENPFQKGTAHFSSIKQAELMRTDPDKGRALAAQAGFQLFE